MPALEQRVVEVNDPALSQDANRRLTEAVREVIGADRVMVPADRIRVSHGERRHLSPMERVTSSRMMALGLVAVGVCVGLVVVTTGESWWSLALAFVVLAVALAAVTWSIIALASTTEYPDAGLVALLAEQGVHDPEVRFTELVQEFTPVADGEYRRTAVEDDPARAAAEQREAITPSGGPSDAVGPES
jgi:hypothetical protein